MTLNNENVRFRIAEQNNIDFVGLDLDGMLAPTFPLSNGPSFPAKLTDNPKYSTTQRLHGTQDTSFRIENLECTKTDRNEARAFYEDTLHGGKKSFSIIDHEYRILFDANWNSWQEQWSRRRGGTHSLSIDIESGAPWTRPSFGFWPMANVDNPERDFIFGLSDLVLQYGTYINTGILRNTGKALECTYSATNFEYAANTTVSYDLTNRNEISMFCQFKTEQINTSTNLRIMTLSDSTGNNTVELVARGVDASTFKLFGRVINDSSTNEIQIDALNKATLNLDTWYDIAISYNQANGNIWVMYWPALGQGESFNHFLDGSTLLSEGLSSYQTSTEVPNSILYTDLYLLFEEFGGMPAGNQAVMQNPILFNAGISQVEFNDFRHWCWLWNQKNSGAWPR